MWYIMTREQFEDKYGSSIPPNWAGGMDMYFGKPLREVIGEHKVPSYSDIVDDYKDCLFTSYSPYWSTWDIFSNYIIDTRHLIWIEDFLCVYEEDEENNIKKGDIIQTQDDKFRYVNWISHNKEGDKIVCLNDGEKLELMFIKGVVSSTKIKTML